jgi:hypothetical protein
MVVPVLLGPMATSVIVRLDGQAPSVKTMLTSACQTLAQMAESAQMELLHTPAVVLWDMLDLVVNSV